MTQQLDAAITQSPEARVQAWLADFESALAARDIERVVAKFVPDSIWRDLVTFTWNIKTVEGREGIADMLRARLADTDPSGFRTRETPTDDEGGVASAFIEFETAVGRGVGHLRLKGDLGWTLLTALDELKGHEEPMGSRRVLGVRNRRRRWAIRSSPTSWSLAAAKAESRWVPGCASWRCRPS